MNSPSKPVSRGWLSRIDPVALGILCSFAASVSYGLGTVVARKAVIGASPYTSALVALAVGLITMVAFSASHVSKDIKVATRRTYFNLTMAGLFAVFGVILLYVGLTKAPVAIVAPVASLTPMFSLVFSHFFLQRLEHITKKVILGTALVVLGVVLISLSSVL